VRNLYFGELTGEGRMGLSSILKMCSIHETGCELCSGTSVVEPSFLLPQNYV
jgi:hypothetical protein